MKFIFCVTVCAIALNSVFVNSDFPHKPEGFNRGKNTTNDRPKVVNHGCTSPNGYCIIHPTIKNYAPETTANQGFSLANFENILHHQYHNISLTIVAAWQICNDTYRVPFNESFDIFLSPPWGDERRLSAEAKCLIDCTLKEMHVITEAGFNETEYMVQIKQLRFNYTTFDAKKTSLRTKRIIWDAIRQKANTFSDGACYYNNSDPNDREHCYELIQSYDLAARTCRDIHHSESNSCETSWMTMRCIMAFNRGRSFEAPFYPLTFVYTNPKKTIDDADTVVSDLNDNISHEAMDNSHEGMDTSTQTVASDLNVSSSHEAMNNSTETVGSDLNVTSSHEGMDTSTQTVASDLNVSSSHEGMNNSTETAGSDLNVTRSHKGTMDNSTQTDVPDLNVSRSYEAMDNMDNSTDAVA